MHGIYAIRNVAITNMPKPLPRVSQPYISAIRLNGLTISGPPEILDDFIENCLSKEQKPMAVSILGPCHPLLYDERDIKFWGLGQKRSFRVMFLASRSCLMATLLRPKTWKKP